MQNLPATHTPLDDEITHFNASDRGYYALLRSGPRLDILRVLTFQPDITDFNAYSTYMFLDTLQGFFLIRQTVIDFVPQPWRLTAQLHSPDPAQLRKHIADDPRSLLRFALALRPPTPPPENPPAP